MSAITGGVAAAAGLGFQYLAAIDELLSALNKSDDDFTLFTEDPVEEVIDFSLQDSTGAYVLVAQAKAAVDGADGRSISIGEIVKIGARLIRSKSKRYVIKTNRALAPGASDLLFHMSTNPLPGDDLDSARLALASKLNKAAADIVLSLADEELRRFWGLEVSVEPGSLASLRARITEGIVDVRRRMRGGIGPETSNILLGHIVAEFLFLSGCRADRSFNRSAATSLLGTAPGSLAQAAGIYEWGRPIGVIPTAMSVHRPVELEVLSNALPGFPLDRRTRKVVLTGLSGMGKSTIARDFANLRSERYDWVVWFDASSEASIRAQVERMVGDGLQDKSDTEVATRFGSLVAESTATWLMVFDNALSSAAVTDWIPSTGHVDVVATSTDATAWVQWPTVSILPLTQEQSLEMVAMRLDLEYFEEHEQVKAVELVEHLGNWPLALELACAFLGGSGRGLDLTEEYLDRLAKHVIDDARLVPAEYRSHTTLLQAVFVALDSLRELDGRGLTGTAMLDALAYLPPRSAPLQVVGLTAALSQSLLSGTKDFREPTDIEIDDGCRALSAVSFAHRIASSEGSLGDSLIANEIVLSIVREVQSEQGQRATLSAAQHLVGQLVLQAFEERRLDVVAATQPSALSILHFAEAAGCLTLESVPLMGNLASSWAARGEHRMALDMYNRELTALSKRQIPVSRLHAKIHAGIASALVHINSPFAEIESAVVLAMDAAEAFETGHRDERGFGSVVDGLAQVVTSLERTAPAEARNKIEALQTRLREIAGGDIADEYRRREIQTLLDDPDGDKAALDIIDEQLVRELPEELKLHLMSTRAEALVGLHRYSEGLRALDHASAYASTLGLDEGSIRTSILNAWMYAANGLLSETEPSGALQFCQQMERRFGGMSPTEADDTARLKLVRAMTAVEREPFHLAKELVDGLDEVVFDQTHLIKSHTSSIVALEACRRIIRIRSLYDGAVILPMRAWARSRLPMPSGEHLPVLIVGISPEDWGVSQLTPSSAARATWLNSELGVGLLLSGLSPTIVWTNQHDTRWLVHAESPIQPGTVRLREILHNPAFETLYCWSAVGKVTSSAADRDPEFSLNETVLISVPGSMSRVPS